MKPLSDDELQMNQDAVNTATSLLRETVVAATRCEQVTESQQLAAAGVGGVNRGLMKGMKAMNRVMMPRLGSDLKNMKTAGLPDRFVLAVTATQIHALEDKHTDGKLVAGKVLKSWDRKGFLVKQGSGAGGAVSRVPDDRQLLILYLPMDGAKSKYMKAAAQNVAAAGAAGMPHKVMVARDAPSQAVIDAVVTAGAPNIMIGGQSLQAMVAGAQPASDPAEQLSKLAALHQRGVLTDEEFSAQKAKVLNDGH